MAESLYQPRNYPHIKPAVTVTGESETSEQASDAAATDTESLSRHGASTGRELSTTPKPIQPKQPGPVTTTYHGPAEGDGKSDGGETIDENSDGEASVVDQQPPAGVDESSEQHYTSESSVTRKPVMDAGTVAAAVQEQVLTSKNIQAHIAKARAEALATAPPPRPRARSKKPRTPKQTSRMGTTPAATGPKNVLVSDIDESDEDLPGLSLVHYRKRKLKLEGEALFDPPRMTKRQRTVAELGELTVQAATCKDDDAVDDAIAEERKRNPTVKALNQLSDYRKAAKDAAPRTVLRTATDMDPATSERLATALLTAADYETAQSVFVLLDCR